MQPPYIEGPRGRQLTASEAAAQLRCSVRTIQRRRIEGEFPGAWNDHGHWRIPQEDVTAYQLRRMPT
jgi:excisionase family DNA binding protein